MIYDTSNPLDKANFLLRAKNLAESGKVIELTEKKAKKKFTAEQVLARPPCLFRYTNR